jgi:hypothetical protein
MANFEYTALQGGLSAAIQRTVNEGFSFPPDSMKEAENLMADALQRWPDELQPRFISLFAENVAVAAIARAVNGEPSLTRSEVAAFLAVDSWFKNSWQHA